MDPHLASRPRRWRVHLPSKDKRPIREQIISGLRLVPWGLLVCGVILTIVSSSMAILGQGRFTLWTNRSLGTLGLAATGIILFRSVRYWVGWLIGGLGYFALRLIGASFFVLLRPPKLQLARWFCSRT